MVDEEFECQILAARKAKLPFAKLTDLHLRPEEAQKAGELKGHLYVAARRKSVRAGEEGRGRFAPP